ncbi:MAG: hypothetical protein O2999_11915 [Nitrospirae bacterium]|nr:hypothetical protein [Nitrospirota bacterium]MDA1304982.1 hypothetical protein [Nitrospirota bacterium]
MPTALIRMRAGEASRMIVSIPYSPERVAKIKTIAGRRWHRHEQYWSVPQAPGALTQLLTLFDGEPVEVDPSLDAVPASQQEKPFPE